MTIKNSERKTILVAEDDESIASVLIQILSLEFYNVDRVASGRKAIEALDFGGINLALLDINMPDISGIGVVQHMKSIPHMRKIPIIMITGQLDAQSVLRCKQLGVNDYLSKPFKISTLLERVKMALEEAAK